MEVVELETPAVDAIYAKLKKLPHNKALKLRKMPPETWGRLKAIAWRDEMMLSRTDFPNGGVALMIKPRRRPVGFFAARARPLDVSTPEEEGQRFAAAVRKYCERRRVSIPRSSELLTIAQHMGYSRTSLGDFESWLDGGAG